VAHATIKNALLLITRTEKICTTGSPRTSLNLRVAGGLWRFGHFAPEHLFNSPLRGKKPYFGEVEITSKKLVQCCTGVELSPSQPLEGFESVVFGVLCERLRIDRHWYSQPDNVRPAKGTTSDSLRLVFIMTEEVIAMSSNLQSGVSPPLTGNRRSVRFGGKNGGPREARPGIELLEGLR